MVLGVIIGKGKPVAQPCIIKLTRATTEGHNVAAYMAVMLLYKGNAGAAYMEAV